MIKLLLKRLGQGVLVIFVLQTITFFGYEYQYTFSALPSAD